MYQHNYELRCEPLQLLDRFSRWRKRAELLKLSPKAKERLEWFIFYFSDAGKKNASYTAYYFSISRSKFYFWLKRFNEKHLANLENDPPIPRRKQLWQPDPVVLWRMINLRKKYIHLSKIKLARIYQNKYGETISSWQFQRVIQKFNLYPERKQKKCQGIAKYPFFKQIVSVFGTF